MSTKSQPLLHQREREILSLIKTSTGFHLWLSARENLTTFKLPDKSTLYGACGVWLDERTRAGMCKVLWKEGRGEGRRTEMCPARIKNTRMSGVLHKQTQHTNTTISEIHCMRALLSCSIGTQHNSRENHSCGIEWCYLSLLSIWVVVHCGGLRRKSRPNWGQSPALSCTDDRILVWVCQNKDLQGLCMARGW